MELEDLIEQLGSFGPYQILLSIIIRLTNAPMAWGMLLMMFAAKVPEWNCSNRPSVQFYNTSAINIKNYTMLADGSNTAPEVTEDTSLNYCNINASMCGEKVFKPPVVTVMSEFELVCDKTSTAGTIISIQMAGVFVFALIAGQLADLIGRKITLFSMMILFCLATGLSSLSNDWKVFAFFRFLIGGGAGGVLTLGIALPMEFTGKRHRAIIAGIPGWPIGSSSFALIAYLLQNWNHISIATAVFTFPFLLTWWYVPESIRWLLAHNKTKQAEEIIIKVARFNNCPIPDLTQLNKVMETEQRKSEKQRRYSYRDLFRTRHLIKTDLILCYMWMFTGLVFYGLNFSAVKLSGNLYLNIFFAAAAEIPADIIIVILCNKIGRRWTVVLFYSIAGAASAAAVVVSFTDLDNKMDISKICALISKFGVATAWAALILFTSESYPTVIRNLGQAACNMSARIGTIIAPQIVFLMPLEGSIFYIVAAFGMITSAIMGLFLKETQNEALSDTIQNGKKQSVESADKETEESYPMVQNGYVPS